jgi:hypothetical protein
VLRLVRGRRLNPCGYVPVWILRSRPCSCRFPSSWRGYSLAEVAEQSETALFEGLGCRVSAGILRRTLVFGSIAATAVVLVIAFSGAGVVAKPVDSPLRVATNPVGVGGPVGATPKPGVSPINRSRTCLIHVWDVLGCTCLGCTCLVPDDA